MHVLHSEVRQGRYPACVEACPVGARKFGNLLDPNSEISLLIKNKRVFRLKEDLNTQPNFTISSQSDGWGKPHAKIRIRGRSGKRLVTGAADILCLDGALANHSHGRDRCLYHAAPARPHRNGMTSYVSWGFYIGNFTFLVGVAAAAVLLIIPHISTTSVPSRIS